MLIRKKSYGVFKKITLFICTLFISVREKRRDKKNNNLETQATLDTRHESKKNKRRRKKCDIDYMSVQ